MNAKKHESGTEQLIAAYAIAQELKTLSERLVVVTEDAVQALGLKPTEGDNDA